MTRSFTVLVAIVALLSGLARTAAAAPPDPAAELSKGELELRAAETMTSDIQKKQKAASALEHFEESYVAGGGWRAAAGASDACLVLGSPPAASGWYWLASDKADYSDAYLAWQKSALERLFSKRAGFTFDFNEPAATLRVDGVQIPVGAFDRALALDAGKHVVLASSQSGNGFESALEVSEEQVGGSEFFHIRFERMLKAGEVDPRATTVGPRAKSPDKGMSVLQIVSIVGTVTLASGIAVGGGYLLFGQDNPRGLDTAEGAAVVITELVVIGAGTAIALLSD